MQDLGVPVARPFTEEDSPDDSVTVYNVIGVQRGRVMYSGQFVQYPGFQVRVRSGDEDDGYAVAAQIRELLSREVNRRVVTVDDIEHQVNCISQLGDVIDAGAETPTSRRRIYTLNGVISYKELT